MATGAVPVAVGVRAATGHVPAMWPTAVGEERVIACMLGVAREELPSRGASSSSEASGSGRLTPLPPKPPSPLPLPLTPRPPPGPAGAEAAVVAMMGRA